MSQASVRQPDRSWQHRHLMPNDTPGSGSFIQCSPWPDDQQSVEGMPGGMVPALPGGDVVGEVAGLGGSLPQVADVTGEDQLEHG